MLARIQLMLQQQCAIIRSIELSTANAKKNHFIAEIKKYEQCQFE